MLTTFVVSLAVAATLIGTALMAYGMSGRMWDQACARVDATAVAADRIHFRCVTADGRVVEP